jgi:hypothetical protein
MASAKWCSGGCVSRRGVLVGTIGLVNLIYHKPLTMHGFREVV